MKNLILVTALLLTTTAHADYWSALKEVERTEKARSDAEFSRLIPNINAWITTNITDYARTLGGLNGNVEWHTFEMGMIKSAQFQTLRGYECDMRIGMVLVDGSFNMLIQCASPQEAKRAGKVFEHRLGRR